MKRKFLSLVLGFTVAVMFTAQTPQAMAADNLFSNGFESNNFSQWSSADTRWSISSSDGHNGSFYKADVAGDTGGSDDSLRKSVSTSGYRALNLSYWYRMTSMESSDHVYVEYSNNNGSTWSILADYTNQSEVTDWVMASHSLPVGSENNPQFQFRFRGHMNSSFDSFTVDDVSLQGTRIPSVTNSTVQANNNYVPTQGGIATIVITVKDSANNPIPGILASDIVVSATGSGNVIAQPTGITSVSGQVTATIQSTIAGDKEVSVTVNGYALNQRPIVTFYTSQPVKANIVSTPSNTVEASLLGSGVDLDITITDSYGNNVPDGVEVTVSGVASTAGTVSVTGSGKTVSGHVTRHLTFNNKGQVTLTVNAYSGNLVLSGHNIIYFVDTTKPVITVTPPNPATVEYRGTYTDAGATASDNIDGNITSSIVTVNSVTPNVINVSPINTSDKIVGVYTVTYNIADSSGNSADQKTRTVNVVDTTAPEVSSLTSDATTSGWLKVGSTVKFTLSLSPAEPIATVVGSYNGKTLTWTTSDAGATYTATYTVAENDTDYKVTPLQITGVTVTDEAGNITTVSGADVQKLLDAHTPVAPVVNLPPFINIANKASVPFNVTGEAGTTINFTVGSIPFGPYPFTGNESYNLDLTGLLDGSVTASVTLTDNAGNVSASGGDTAIKDIVAPTAPSVTLPSYINLLNQSAPVISGTGEANATLNYAVKDSGTGTVSGTGPVSAGGSVSITALNLSGLLDGALILTASQTDAAGNSSVSADTTSFKDTVKPTVVLSDDHADNIVRDADTVTITATFVDVNGIDEVTPKISIGTLVTDALMTKVNNLIWTYEWDVPTGNDGTHSVTVSAKDVPGNTNEPATGKTSYVIDNTAPVFTNTAPAEGAYVKGDYTVGYTLNEDLQSGSVEFHSVSLGSCALTGSNLLTGSHVLSNEVLTACGISLSEGAHTITFKGTDIAGNPISAPTNNFIYDVTAPTVLNVTSTKSDGTYKAGEVIDISVQFSETVNATTYYRPGGCGMWYGSGCWDTIDQRPYFILETGGTDRNANYESGTGTDTLVFRYTVQPGDTSADLDYLSSGALMLNSQSIKDLAGNDASLTLATPGATHSLGANKNIVIDTTAPTVTLSSTFPERNNVKPIPFAVHFSEPVTGFISSDVDVTNGSITSASFAGSGTDYSFTVTPDGTDPEDVTITVGVKAGVAVDIAGNENTAAVSLNRVYDTVQPTVTNVELKEGASAYDGVVKAGNVLIVNVTMSEVLLSAPEIGISGAGQMLVPLMMSKDDDTHYTYNYTVLAPGEGTANISLAGAIDLAGNVSVSHASTTFVVDNTKPVITVPANITTIANQLGGKVVTYVATANDSHDGSLTPTCVLPSGSLFPVSQTTTVNCNVTDQAGNAADQQSFTITVNPDVIASLHITGATPVTVPGPSLITVTGKDQYGNIVTNDSTTIVALSADNGGALAQTVLTLTNGVATTGLTKTESGDVHVTVTSGVLPPANTLVHFSPADTTGPNITSFSPALNATNVSVTAPLFFVFNEPLKLSSVNSTNVQLWKMGSSTLETVDTKISATVALVEGGMRVNISPATALDYNSQYYFVVTSGVTDETGNLLTNPKDWTTTGFTTAVDTADHTAPTIETTNPIEEATGVALTITPSITFSESLLASTVSSDSIKLYNGADLVPATVSLVEGGTKAVITPSISLANNTTYHFVVSTGITDIAGNPLATEHLYSFTTEVENVQLAVTESAFEQSFATPDDTWEHGWRWVLTVTAPSAETELSMKFADFVSGSDSIPAANNIRISSAQGTGTVTMDAANTYKGFVHLNSDLDTSTPGRQFKVMIQVKVPTGTPGGSYSTSYGIQTIAPIEE